MQFAVLSVFIGRLVPFGDYFLQPIIWLLNRKFALGFFVLLEVWTFPSSLGAINGLIPIFSRTIPQDAFLWNLGLIFWFPILTIFSLYSKISLCRTVSKKLRTQIQEKAPDILGMLNV